MNTKTKIIIGGVVLVGMSIYFINNFKNKNSNTKNLSPPMEVEEEEIDENDKTSTKENVILSGLDRLKEILESLKSKDVSTPPINN